MILAVILIASFFLPYRTGYGLSASGYDIVSSEAGRNGSWEILVTKYIWLLIPVSGLILLLGSINKERYFLGRNLWAWLPLLTVIFMLVKLFLDAKNTAGRSVPVKDLISLFGMGFWVAFVAALILAFYNPHPSY